MGSASTGRVGVREVDGVTRRVLHTWQLLGLAIKELLGLAIKGLWLAPGMLYSA